MDKNNVSTAKPRVGGGIYSAPLGSTLPTDAVSQIGSAFAALGYISEDGIRNTNTPDSDSHRAWGGDIVDVTNKGKDDKFVFKLIEGKNVDVLKTIYGAANVSGTLDGGISVKATTTDAEHRAYIIDMVLKGGTLKRIVIPDAVITDVAEITYKTDDLVGYEITLTAMADSAGVTHTEYIKGGS